MSLLANLNEMTAGEGLPIVLLSGLQMLGALLLIVGVLVVMDIVFKKKHPEWKDGTDESEETMEEASESEETKE